MGENVQDLYGSSIARIYGLDPAEPYFKGVPDEVCLVLGFSDSSQADLIWLFAQPEFFISGTSNLENRIKEITDANFVSIIHSDATQFLNGGLQGMGVGYPIGHMDFWPNNGTNHPGCDQGTV